MLTAAVLSLFALLALTGVLTSLMDFLFVSPARSATESFEERAESFQASIFLSRQTVFLLNSNPAIAEHGKLLTPLTDSLGFASFAVSAAIVAVHVINIFLILSEPAGLVLLSLLFILLSVLQFIEKDRRLRNISMAVGTAAYVFVFAMPVSVFVSGQLSQFYTSSLRYVTQGRLENFSEAGYLLLESLPDREEERNDYPLRTDLIVMVKGIPRFVWFGSASWLLDLAVIPVGLSWLLYRLGIFIANTIFGSFRMQKIGEIMKKIFRKLP